MFEFIKFMFSKKATKIDEIFTVDLTLTIHNVKSTVKISSTLVAFLENMNFINVMAQTKLKNIANIFHECAQLSCL